MRTLSIRYAGFNFSKSEPGRRTSPGAACRLGCMRMRRVVVLTIAACLIQCAVWAQTAKDGEQQFGDLGACKLASGAQIDNCRLGYRTWGRLNAERSNAVLFPTWFSGRTGDLVGQVGADKLVDPAGLYVITVDALGDGVSSSPSNSKTQHGPLFPAITTRDMVNAEYRLATETLGLKHLRAVMGISMGGMQTFEWLVNYPDFMDVAVPMVGSTKLTGYDLLLWQSEVDAIHGDPDWKGGWYTQAPPAGRAEMLSEMNLTTPARYAREHPPEKFGEEYAAYFSTGILPFDANDYLEQLEAMIHHDAAHGATMEEAARKVKAKVLVVVAAQDHMVNPGPALAFAKLLGARTLVIKSVALVLSIASVDIPPPTPFPRAHDGGAGCGRGWL